MGYTKGDAYLEDARRTQASLLDNAGSQGGKLDVFRGVRDMEDQIIVHLRDYTGDCPTDHLRFTVEEAKEAVGNLEFVTTTHTNVHVSGKDNSKGRGYVATITNGRLRAGTSFADVAFGDYPVDVDWAELKKALQKAWRQPRKTADTT
jgi:hypothetical protein